ncbi:MAG: TonB-dependent receptor [Hymenobacter sp.]
MAATRPIFTRDSITWPCRWGPRPGRCTASAATRARTFWPTAFRNGVTTGANYSPLYPNGYLPELPGRSDDYSAVVGLRRALTGGWNLDFSTGYGHNFLDLYANKTANASLGATSSTDFYVGRSAFGQSTSEVNVSRNYSGVLGTKSLNVAFGSQFRADQFVLKQGSAESFLAGPLATSAGKAPGSNGRPGIAPADETNSTRTNVGVYLDLESDLTERLLLTAAGRYENYSDFGSNVSGKICRALQNPRMAFRCAAPSTGASGPRRSSKLSTA